jgi:hypothetical protein
VLIKMGGTEVRGPDRQACRWYPKVDSSLPASPAMWGLSFRAVGYG